MSRSSLLGKRTRSLQKEEQVQLPQKRTRRQTRAALENDENVDPDTAATPESDCQLDDEVDAQSVTNKLKCSHSQTLPKTIPITPSTPRHRDAFANSPSTPRQVVKSAGKLFQRMTPQSPLTPGSLQTVYHSARQLFARGAEPGQLVGRENEREQLTQFARKCLSSGPNGCLYVSGPPGTGKSAMVKEVTEQLKDCVTVRQAYVNCMSIKSSKDLYNTLLDLLGHESDLPETLAMEALQSIFLAKKKKKESHVYLVVLDEIDHILTMGLESLYRLFEWSLQQPSRLAMVGIANALDLTDRFLPRLKSKNLKPALLPFHPYSATQIKSIITTRLMTLLPEDSKQTTTPFLHPAAIELCSRKVSSQTGDLRKAFEICRRALDLVESETRRQHENEAREKILQMTPSRKPLGEKANMAPSGGSSRSVSHVAAASLRALTAETAPRASIGHLNKVTQAAFSNGTNQRLKALNLQQKAALCALVALEKRNRATKMANGLATPTKSQQTLAPTVKTLYDTYSILCTRDSVLHPLSSSEFREVVGSLETLGLVNPVDGKTGGLVATQTPSKRGRKAALPTGEDKRVASCVGEQEMESIAEGVGAGILTSILSGEALD